MVTTPCHVHSGSSNQSAGDSATDVADTNADTMPTSMQELTTMVKNNDTSQVHSTQWQLY